MRTRIIARTDNAACRQNRLMGHMQRAGFELEVSEKPFAKIVAPTQPACDVSLEKRLANWRDTVRDGKSSSSTTACASWAKAYVASRNEREQQLAIALQITRPESNLSRIEVDELDGWLIEEIVRSMIHFDQKQALRYRYVFNYPDHWIKTKLQIRDNALRIVMGRALNNLKLLLDKLDSPVKIRSYNSHAGIVPRPEALAVPLGTPAPLES
jgi:hypothetical protein